MHPRLAAVITHADTARAELLAAVDAIPEPLREARPTETAWSAAEVLEHLMRVEKGIAKLLVMKVGEVQAMPDAPREALNIADFSCPRLDVLLDRASRIDAPERVVPVGELSADAARGALLETRRSLLEQLHAADGLALSSVIHPHPFLGPLDLYEWVYFVALHERRHTAQVREIAAHFATAN